ncbi:MAG: hypothetical protein Kow00104_03730 [Rhodothalassiaceae bacterium]
MIGNDMLSLAMDGVLLVFLGAVLIAALRVNRRLREMRDGQTELADLVLRLESATDKAREALAGLRKEGAEAEESLRRETRRARALADELTLITEAGDNLAGRLEKSLTARGDRAEAEVTALHAAKPDLMDKIREAR